MQKIGSILVAVILATLAGPAGLVSGAESLKSDNIKEIARAPIPLGDDSNAAGSDLAFRDDLLVAGTYQGTAFFKILKKAPYVKQLGFHRCPGAQGDVTVHGDLVFVSLDSPQREDIGCSEPSAKASTGKEGIRILDISNPAKPIQVAFVETDCGSHTHSTLQKGNKIYAYIQSYPLSVPSATCSVASHRKVSIVEIPINEPTKAKVVSALDVSPEIGCHDVTIFPKKDLAAAACIGESQIWDISDPAAPVIISRIYNPSIEIHHGVGLTWDEKYLVIADEFAGSVTGECAGNQRSPIGALWFYEISDPEVPLLSGYYNVPRGARPDSFNEAAYVVCTSHNFNILPMKDPKRYVASVGYRSAGLSVVDFSDPMAPEEIGYFQQLENDEIPDVWSAYWYNGRIYSNDNGANRGVSVYEMKGLDAKKVRYFKGDVNPQNQRVHFR